MNFSFEISKVDCIIVVKMSRKKLRIYQNHNIVCGSVKVIIALNVLIFTSTIILISEANTGIVKDFVNIQDSYRGAVTVEWKHPPKRLKLDEHSSDNDNNGDDDEEGDLPFYRVGANGKVELRLIAPSPEKRHVYINHLPVLGLYRYGFIIEMEVPETA